MLTGDIGTDKIHMPSVLCARVRVPSSRRIRARRGKSAANFGAWYGRSERLPYDVFMSCIIMLAPCIKRRGYPFPSQRTPAWTVQKPEYSASRSPSATPRIGEAARSASFGARRDEKRALSPHRILSASQNCLSKDSARSNRRSQRLCSHPGLLNIPKNARRTLGDPCMP